MPFDEDYYRRLYGDPATRVHGPEEIAHLARAVTELIAWFGAPLASVLDVGAGTGLWGAWLREHHPEVRVRSIDVSEHACRTYGHEQRDIATWCDPAERHDLVICQGVLGYLDDAACAAAVGNLAAMTAGFLYVFVTTTDDLRRRVVDTGKTDLSGHLRPARFYLDLLEQYFVRVGAGLFQHHAAPGSLFALERAD
jgi:hypothetical protein